MDRVEGLMSSVKLSEMESKGRKIVLKDGGKMGVVDPQPVEKLISDKPAYAEALGNALGRVWCPMKGFDCKETGENVFMFTHHQASGKMKALEEGPWDSGRHGWWWKIFCRARYRGSMSSARSRCG